MKLIGHILIVFYIYMHILCIALEYVDKEQEDFLRTHCGPNSRQGCKPCGIVLPGKVNPSSSQSKSRLINAKPKKPNKIYPWIVQTNSMNPLYPQTPTLNQVHRANGVIVTSKVVLTCGHCICADAGKMDQFDLRMSCRTNKLNQEENQNVEGKNHISVTPGAETYGYLEYIDHNPNLEAYLYEYRPIPDEYFSENGDIGIIILRNDLEMDLSLPSNLGAICLPSSNAFEYGTNSEINVRVAGWGDQYDETTALPPRQTSCVASEAMEVPSDRFSACKPVALPGSNPPPHLEKSYCAEIPKEYATLSTSAPVKFKYEGQKLQLNIEDAEKKLWIGKCEDYLRQIREFLTDADKNPENYRDPYRMSLERFDRLGHRFMVLSKKDIKRILATCYVIEKSGKYGICQTEQSTTRDWGLCSKSCDYSKDPKPKRDAAYDQAKMTYYEKPPGGSKMAVMVQTHPGKRKIFE